METAQERVQRMREELARGERPHGVIRDAWDDLRWVYQLVRPYLQGR